MSEVIDILDNIYLIKRSSDWKSVQLNKKMIIKALDTFVELKRAQKLSDSSEDPEYLVKHDKISTQKYDLLDYLIKEIHKEEFEERADIEIKKIQNNKNLDAKLQVQPISNLKVGVLRLHLLIIQIFGIKNVALKCGVLNPTNVCDIFNNHFFFLPFVGTGNFSDVGSSLYAGR